MPSFGRKILVLVVLVFLVSCTKGNDASEKTLVIGAIASLTGPAGEQGKNWLQGAQLAVDDVRASFPDVEVKLVVEDDQTTPVNAVKAFQRLVTQERVQAIIGGTWDFLAEACYPLADQYKTPFFTVTNPPEILGAAASRSRYVFTNALSLTSEKDAARRLLEQEKIRSLALVYPNVPFGVVHAEMMKTLAAELGIEVVYDNQFTLETALHDVFKISADRIKSAHPDLAYIVTDYNGLDLLTTELEIIESNPKILTTQHLDQAFLFSRNARKYRSSFGIYPKIESMSFSKAFQEKFDTTPKVYSAHGYDIVEFITRAIRAGVDISDPKAQFRYEGITGVHSLPVKGGRALSHGDAVIMTTRSGIFEEWH